MPTYGGDDVRPMRPKGPQPSRLLMALLNPKPAKRRKK
jgi:hypothetical protein